MFTLIVLIVLIKFNLTESHWNQQLRYIRSESTTKPIEQLTSNQSSTSPQPQESPQLNLTTDLYFVDEPEILSRSKESVELRIFPIKKHLRNQVQCYFVIVETVNTHQSSVNQLDQNDGSQLTGRNYSYTYGQSADQQLPYYAAIKLTPEQLATQPIELKVGSNDGNVNNYLNPPLKPNRQYRFGLAALTLDNQFLIVQSSRSVILESTDSDLIKTLIALFAGLIVILLIIIAGLIYYLREAEVDVRWQDVVMIWSKRHRSSLFKDRNRSYRRCEDHLNRLTISCGNNNKSSNKFLSGSLDRRLHTNSYINMEVEHHLIDLPSLDVSLRDSSFLTILHTEFNSIPFMQMPSIDGTKPENRKKNRYVYIPAFDFNRVKLIVDEDEKVNIDSTSTTTTTIAKESTVGDEENKNDTDGLTVSSPSSSSSSSVTIKPTDYINASYIDGYNQLKSYIATQGPLNWTFNDFWKMIWQQDSCQIVMLTGLYESGKIKCDQYWPDDGESNTYGKIAVKHSSTNTDSVNYVIRKFTVTKGDESREVILYHYVNWPDHGAPADPEPLLNLIETIKSDGKQLPSQGPIVTHCSAGVGRTGTYIMIDIMMKMGQQENAIDVLGQLYLLRRQRIHMIETEDQYIFVHKAINRYFAKKSNGDDQDKVINETTANKMAEDKQATAQLINMDSDAKSTVEP